MANEQINVPSLVVILVLSGLIIRYLFFSSPPTAPPQQQRRQPSSAIAMLRSREAAYERIQQMFPQVDRRAVLWDLQRTGGNIAATTERILAGRLETPPATFQPPPPPRNPDAPAASTAQAPQPQTSKPTEPDLITRYNLKDKLNSPPEEDASGDAARSGSGNGKAPKGWSSSREERQSLLQKRRDQMILEARRKMEAKIAAEKAAAESSGSREKSS
ncbi:hypothetical protein VTK73DRAFT_7096 [Phialemonium thermophilum]|uniref:CUE domain-containing protein n=1 Tax=Phialemonium thermophilum TaxID=223376 RepID=A0ABR3XUJ9_9PEZI